MLEKRLAAIPMMADGLAVPMAPAAAAIAADMSGAVGPWMGDKPGSGASALGAP